MKIRTRKLGIAAAVASIFALSGVALTQPIGPPENDVSGVPPADEGRVTPAPDGAGDSTDGTRTGRQPPMLNIGVIGYGYWGPNLVRNFAELNGATLAGVADLDPRKLELVQKRFPAVKTTTDFQELLKDPEFGPRVVPIIPDEARTFGLDALFREYKIYAPFGQRYEPVDAELEAGIPIPTPATRGTETILLVEVEPQRAARRIGRHRRVIQPGAGANLGRIPRRRLCDVGKSQPARTRKEPQPTTMGLPQTARQAARSSQRLANRAVASWRSRTWAEQPNDQPRHFIDQGLLQSRGRLGDHSFQSARQGQEVACR